MPFERKFLRIYIYFSRTPDMVSPNSSTADYLVPLTHYSFSNTTPTPSHPDSNPTTPTTPQIPESESTETMLDEDDPVNGKCKDSGVKYADVTVKAGGANSISSGASNNNTNLNKANVNGIDTGVTLNAAGLDKVERSTSSPGTRCPAQYANIGVSKPRLPSPVNLTSGSGGGGGGVTPTSSGERSDEEIRC